MFGRWTLFAMLVWTLDVRCLTFGRLAKVLLYVLLTSECQLVIPFGAKTLCERLLEKLIYANALSAAHHLGAFAYLPAVIVDGSIAVVLLHAHGVEVA